jgi:hypothetical protein
MDPSMAMPDDMRMSTAGSVLHFHANSCTHSSCNESSTSAIAKSAAQHPIHALILIAFARPIAAAGMLRVGWTTPNSGPPDLQPFDPLSVSLRI